MKDLMLSIGMLVSGFMFTLVTTDYIVAKIG